MPCKGAEILVDALIAAGVQVIFGVPGDTGVVFYDALYARRGEIRHVLARDERAAAAMADAYARLTNRIGVVEASSGGGATYLVGGLGEPFAASVPLLVLTTDIPRESRGSGAITEVDQSVLFAAVTKWRHTIDVAAEIPAAVHEAIRAATSGRPGPVSLVLPENVLDEQAEVRQIAVDSRVPRERPEADWAMVREVAQSLALADRPAIVAGSGVHLSQAWEELALFSEQCGVPVATTIHGKGAVAETSPWSLGVAGGNGARDYANDYLAKSDWVLFLGTRANATDTNGFTSPPREGDAFIALVDLDSERIGRNYPRARVLLGDVRTVLRQLRSLADAGQAERRQEIMHQIADERSRWESEQGQFSASYGLDPRDIVTTVQQASRNNSLVVADAVPGGVLGVSHPWPQRTHPAWTWCDGLRHPGCSRCSDRTARDIGGGSHHGRQLCHGLWRTRDGEPAQPADHLHTSGERILRLDQDAAEPVHGPALHRGGLLTGRCRRGRQRLQDPILARGERLRAGGCTA